MQLNKESIREIFKRYELDQVIRFVLVGLVNTAFSYLVYAILLYVGLNFALANFGAVLLGILFSFRTQGALVFHNTDPKLLSRFVVMWTTIYLLTITIIGILNANGVDPYTAGALALPLSAIASFLLQKYFVFRQE